jgi:kinesin family protein 4/21/27
VHTYTSEQLCAALDAVASGAASISAAVGPAVGCLMATFGTSLITDCIFDFEDPEQLAEVGLQQRLELWGLQVVMVDA